MNNPIWHVASESIDCDGVTIAVAGYMGGVIRIWDSNFETVETGMVANGEFRGHIMDPGSDVPHPLTIVIDSCSTPYGICLERAGWDKYMPEIRRAIQAVVGDDT